MYDRTASSRTGKFWEQTSPCIPYIRCDSSLATIPGIGRVLWVSRKEKHGGPPNTVGGGHAPRSEEGGGGANGGVIRAKKSLWQTLRRSAEWICH